MLGELTTVPEEIRRVMPEVVDRARMIALPSPVSMRRIDLAVPVGGSIADMFAAIGVDPGVPARVFLDDRMIALEERARVFPKAGEVVTIRVTPGEPISLTALLVSISSFAASAASAVGTAAAFASAVLGPIAGVATSLSTIAGSISLISGLITNALVAPSGPSQPQLQSNPRTFSVSGSQNVAAPFSPIPKILGTRQIAPQYAATPYIELVGGDQYLRMLFLMGYGPLDISQILIENTAIETYQDVEWELREGFPDDSPVRLYPGSVVEDDFSIVLNTDHSAAPPTTTPFASNNRTSGTGADELNVVVQFLSGYNATDATNGNAVWIQCTLQIQWRLHGSMGAWTQEPDIVLASHGKGHARRGHTWRVPRGQYDVQVQLIRFAAQNNNWSNLIYNAVCTWTSLTTMRAQAPFSLGGLALLALRIRASRQLNGVIDSLTCVASSILPDYNAASLATDKWRDRAGGWTYDYDNHGAGALSYTLDSANAHFYTPPGFNNAITGKRWITDYQLGIANGSTLTFSGTLQGPPPQLTPLVPIQPGSLIISCGTKASVTSGVNTRKKSAVVATVLFIMDDGQGNIVGPTVSAGTINYATGAWSITFMTAPGGGDNPTADFVQLVQTQNAGQALAIKTAASTDGASVASKSIPCVILPNGSDGSTGSPPAVKFTISGWYKASAAISAGIRIRVMFYATEDFPVNAMPAPASIDIISNGAATTSYQQFTQQVTVPAGNSWMRVIAYHNPDAVGGVTVYFDDFSAKPVDQAATALEWMPNPSFDFAGRITSNPASIYRDVLQCPANKQALADVRIDLNTLQNWWTNSQNAGHFFNGILDQPGTVFDSLRMVAPLGRAAYQLRDGLYSVVQDVPQSTIVQHFTPRNSWGFKGTFAFPNLPQALRVRWTNPANNWQPDERIVYDDKSPTGGIGETGVLFNGSSGEVTLPTLLATVNANATLEAWVKLPASGAKGCFIKLGSGNGFGLGVGAAGTTFDDSNPGTALIGLYEGVAWLFPTGNPTLSTGVWHQVAMVIGATATAPTFYIDGTAYAGTASNTPNAPTSAGIIGQDPAGTRWTNAAIARVAVYNSALSGTRIAAHAAATTDSAYDTAVLADSPVAFYKLSESSGANAADSSGNGSTGTYSGTGVTLQQTGPLTGAIAYDATTTTLFETLDLTNSVTDINQAWKEGRFHLAQGRLRPQTYELQCDVENLVCQRGDLIRVSHDVIAQGLGFARVKSLQLDGSNSCLGVTLDETSLVMNYGAAYALRFRKTTNGSSLLENLINPATAVSPTITSDHSAAWATACVAIAGLNLQPIFNNILIGPSGTGISAAVPMTTLAPVGDLLMVQLGFQGANPGTITPPAGWALLSLVSDATKVATQALFYKLCNGAEPASYTFGWLNSVAYLSFSIDITQVIGDAPLDGIAGQGFAANSSVSPPFPVSKNPNNDMVLLFTVQNSGAATLSASSFNVYTISGGGNVGFGCFFDPSGFSIGPGFTFATPIPAANPQPAVGDLAMFGLQGSETGQFLVTKIEPGQDLSATITFVDYSPEIYAADALPSTQSSQLVATPSVVAPVIASIDSDDQHSVRAPDGSILGRVMVSLTPPASMLTSGGAIVGVEYEIRVNDTNRLNNRGAWSSATTYNTSDLVTSGGQSWVSIADSNLNITPGTDGSKWTLLSEDTPWSTPALVPAGQQILIEHVEAGTVYDIQLRYVYEDGSFSPWSVQTAYTVLGQVTLPPDVTGLTATNSLVGKITLKWNAVTMPNLREYEIRVGASWAAGTFVGRSRTTTFKTDPQASGSYTFWVGVLDTSGNYSANPLAAIPNPIVLTTSDTVGKNVDTPGINPNAVTSTPITDVVLPITLGLPSWASANAYANGNQIADGSGDAQQVIDQKVTEWNVASGALANGCGTSLDDFPWMPTTATPSPTGPTISASKPWISQTLALKAASTTIPITRRAVIAPAAQAAASSVVVNVPTGTVNGDGLIFAIIVGSTTATVTTPTGLTFIRADSNAGSAGNGSKTWLYYRVASSEPASYTFSISASNPISGGAVGYVGTASGAFVDQNAGQTGTGTAIITVQAVTPSQAFDEILNIYTWSNNNVTTSRTLTPTSSVTGGSAPTWNTTPNGYTQDNYVLWQNVGAGYPHGVWATIATVALTVLAASDPLHFQTSSDSAFSNFAVNDEADLQILDAPNWPSLTGAVVIDSHMPIRSP